MEHKILALSVSTLMILCLVMIIIVNLPKESNSEYELVVFSTGEADTCFGIYTDSNKTETIKMLTEFNENKTIYPLVLTLGEGCPYRWSKTYYSDEEFPEESVCFEGSCLIKYDVNVSDPVVGGKQNG